MIGVPGLDLFEFVLADDKGPLLLLSGVDTSATGVSCSLHFLNRWSYTQFLCWYLHLRDDPNGLRYLCLFFPVRLFDRPADGLLEFFCQPLEVAWAPCCLLLADKNTGCPPKVESSMSPLPLDRDIDDSPPFASTSSLNLVGCTVRCVICNDATV